MLMMGLLLRYGKDHCATPAPTQVCWRSTPLTWYRFNRQCIRRLATGTTSIRLGKHHPPGRCLPREHTFPRLLGKLIRDAADGGLGLRGDAIFCRARAVPVSQEKTAGF